MLQGRYSRNFLPPNEHCEYDWQHAYTEYINDLDVYQGLYIDDINGDDIPEVVIEQYVTFIKPYDMCRTIVIYYNENGLAELELKIVFDWGSISYITNTKQILLCDTFGNYEEYYLYLYDWTGTEYTETLSVSRKGGHLPDADVEFYGESSQAYINGEEVDNDTFEAKLAELKELEQNNRYFPVVRIWNENFESYVKEKPPDFKMPESN